MSRTDAALSHTVTVIERASDAFGEDRGASGVRGGAGSKEAGGRGGYDGSPPPMSYMQLMSHVPKQYSMVI